MTLQYNPYFKNYFKGWSDFSVGFFINSTDSDIVKADFKLVDHDQDTIVRIFKEFYNPYPYQAYCDKQDVIELLEKRINYILSLGYKNIGSERKIALKMYRYFLMAYKSKHTKMWENGIDVVDLTQTTGYKPIFEYGKYNEFNFFDCDGYPSRYMYGSDMLEILKSILIQFCDIDSLESALPNTILTSKFNIYETFYNYLLMDFDIQVIPKKIFDPATEKFVDYNHDDFFIPDSELRLKEEIISIKRSVKLEERYKYFK